LYFSNPKGPSKNWLDYIPLETSVASIIVDVGDATTKDENYDFIVLLLN